MMRQLSFATRMFALAATVAVPTIALAQADTRPVVVVFRFDNSAMGAGSADFAGISTGVQDLLITELAANPKYRLVDRSKISEVLAEQKLTADRAVDPQTAIRLGNILGAQYAITGGWITDGKGNAILTARSIDIETTQIANPQKLTGKTDNVLDMLSQLATKVSSEMKLASKPGAERRVGDAGNAAKTAPAQTGTAAKSAATQSGAPTKASESNVIMYSKPVDRAVVEKTMKTKVDVGTMKVYSTALDEMDRKNTAKAKELFNQVLAKYPDFEPARRNLNSLG